jgi:hypothetical protein
MPKGYLKTDRGGISERDSLPIFLVSTVFRFPGIRDTMQAANMCRNLTAQLYGHVNCCKARKVRIAPMTTDFLKFSSKRGVVPTTYATGNRLN